MKDNFQRHIREKDLVRNNKNQAKETAKIEDHETVIYFEQPHTRLNLARTITESLALITCLCMSYNQGKLIATSGIKVRHLVGQMRLLHVFSSILKVLLSLVRKLLERFRTTVQTRIKRDISLLWYGML